MSAGGSNRQGGGSERGEWYVLSVFAASSSAFSRERRSNLSYSSRSLRSLSFRTAPSESTSSTWRVEKPMKWDCVEKRRSVDALWSCSSALIVAVEGVLRTEVGRRASQVFASPWRQWGRALVGGRDAKCAMHVVCDSSSKNL